MVGVRPKSPRLTLGAAILSSAPRSIFGVVVLFESPTLALGVPMLSNCIELESRFCNGIAIELACCRLGRFYLVQVVEGALGGSALGQIALLNLDCFIARFQIAELAWW